jgi:hypothetical protein
MSLDVDRIYFILNFFSGILFGILFPVTFTCHLSFPPTSSVQSQLNPTEKTRHHKRREEKASKVSQFEHGCMIPKPLNSIENIILSSPSSSMNTIESATSISFRAKPNSHSHPQQRLSSSTSSSLSTSTSASISISKQLPRNSQDQEGRIRLRLLHRLGIDPKQSMRRSIQPSPSAENRVIRTKTVSVPFLQPIKDSINSHGKIPLTFSSSFFAASEASCGSCDIAAQWPFVGSSEERTTASIVTAPRRRRTVRFDNHVLVVPIPSRHAYSNRIKQALWRSGVELRDTVKKNRYEFTVEGWDWNQVLEDEDMFVDVATGEKVHPCWVECREEHENERESENVKESAKAQLERCEHFEHLSHLCADRDHPNTTNLTTRETSKTPDTTDSMFERSDD